VGVQPVLTQVPPNKCRSIMATVIPAAVSRPVSEGPAWPAPMTIASKFFITRAPFPVRRRVNHTPRREPLSASALVSMADEPQLPVSQRFAAPTAASAYWRTGYRRGGSVVAIGFLGAFAGLELAGPLGGSFQHFF
jgi:hypothetical protein